MARRSYTPPTSTFANLSLLQDADHPGMPSPNAMMIDQPEEHVVEPNGTDSDNLAIINPDETEQALPDASDCRWQPHLAPPSRHPRHLIVCLPLSCRLTRVY
jgi:ubiquitin carboxyl-terminal hydrolase 7